MGERRPAPPPGGYRCVGLLSKLPSSSLRACPAIQKSSMTILARLSAGRILLHLIAMLGDRSVRFHFKGIARELPWIASGLAMLIRAPSRLLAALTLYLAQPINHSITDPSADPQSLVGVLKRGDVLLTRGNSRFAALIRCVTRSPWSHVSMYVGPLGDGPDPLCVVEADIAAGVRSIRLSELNALHVRVLRPVGITDGDRGRLADWVVGQIGRAYDLSHAWGLLRNELRLRLPDRFGAAPRKIACSATGFICCSLLAHAFAWIGYPILPDQMRVSLTLAADPASLIPSDFERASIFAAVDGE